jgi:S-adenosyl methyltransferase
MEPDWAEWMRPDWAEQVDVTRPNVARMYDYYLGGMHNFAADRELAEQVLAHMPEGLLLARENRSFLRRAVRHCVADGVTQFLDLGSGIPTVGNVHQVAQAADPAARVVYVDTDPVAVRHSRNLLAGNELAGMVAGDLRYPAVVLADPVVEAVLDLSRPVAVLLVSVLHFVPDDEDPSGVVAGYLDAMPAGSRLVLSHGSTLDHHDGMNDAEGLYRQSATGWTLRTPEVIAGFFAGCPLEPPGLVRAADWRPDEPPRPGTDSLPLLVGVGRKP